MRHMTIDEARAILASDDDTETARSLEAVAVVLRFNGISEPRLIDIAKDIEEAVAELRDGGEPA
jgi:hypothetical protein